MFFKINDDIWALSCATSSERGWLQSVECVTVTTTFVEISRSRVQASHWAFSFLRFGCCLYLAVAIVNEISGCGYAKL